MQLTVLAVPGCPNAPVLEQRLAEATAGRPGVTIRRVEVADIEGATEQGMSGSPTLLIDGRDPFAQPGAGPALACRLYRDDDGRLPGAPSIAALRRALDQDTGVSHTGADQQSP